MALPDECDVLFVDDEPAILRSTQMLGGRTLANHNLTGHSLLVGQTNPKPIDSITEIEPGQVAETIMRLRPRLVLSDFQMPGIDGLQVLEQIRAVDAEWLQKRDEILRTGQTDRERLLFMINSGLIPNQRIAATTEAYQRGDLAFLLTKPTPIKEVLSLLAISLKRQLTEEELEQLKQYNSHGIKDLLGIR